MNIYRVRIEYTNWDVAASNISTAITRAISISQNKRKKNLEISAKLLFEKTSWEEFCKEFKREVV